VSAVAVLSVAAVCAGAVYFERWRVKKAAKLRSQVRRQRRPWDAWAVDAPPPVPEARPLARAIEKAVLAGDMAFAYRDRLDPGMARGESPFQFRRGRIEASVRRYEVAVDRLTHMAGGWLTGDDDASPISGQCRAAVARMLEDLERGGRAAPSLANMEVIDATLDVLENAFANLVFMGAAGPRSHPFR
jgi:hypothetical protein